MKPKESIIYRIADINDYKAIANLHAQNWQKNYRGILDDDYLDNKVHSDRLKVWHERLSQENHLQMIEVATSDQQIVGFVCSFLDYHPQWGCYLDNLHVSEEYQGRGIGRMLMHKSASFVILERPQSPLFLWVFEKNKSAINIYRHLGGLVEGPFFIDLPSGGGKGDVLKISWSNPSELLMKSMNNSNIIEAANYTPIDCNLYDHFEIAAMHQTKVRIHHKASIDEIAITNTVIKTLYTKNNEEYLVTSENEEIRLDKIQFMTDQSNNEIVDLRSRKSHSKNQ